MELHMHSVKELRRLLDKGELSASELTGYYLDRINKLDKDIFSYITVTSETALEQAKAAQAAIDSGKSTPVTGIPVSIEDNICTKGIKTTCASKMLADFVPPYSATAVERLNASNAVMLGKSNMDEFAAGPASQTSYFGGVKNPLDLSRIPGGSSGGAAASVAAGLCAAAIASDTGGSIRQPASFCGVTGIKPTYGAVSRWGLVGFASSFDQIGVIAKSSSDCADMLDAIIGRDENDATSLNYNAGSTGAKLGRDLKGCKIALPKEFFGEGISASVKDAVMKAASWYEGQGCEIIEASMPSLKFAIVTYYIISSAEASSNLARYDGIKFGYRSPNGETYDEVIKNTRAEGFGTEVKRRILLGNYALSSGYYDAYYKKALIIREQIKKEYADIFASADLILTPTNPSTAPKIGELESDLVAAYLSDICTVTVNIAGLPAVSTPCGYAENGMPIGMSLVGKPFGEADILWAADAFEAQFERREVRL